MISEAAVRDAVSTVDDPEYPGLSIVDLGLLESIDVQDSCVVVDLIPTFSGCPALDVIRRDVERAVTELPDVDRARVRWLPGPAWTTDRMSDRAREVVEREYTVAVQVGTGPARCPRCGAPTRRLSDFGPNRCRAVHRCDSCREVVEVMRS